MHYMIWSYDHLQMEICTLEINMTGLCVCVCFGVMFCSRQVLLKYMFVLQLSPFADYVFLYAVNFRCIYRMRQRKRMFFDWLVLNKDKGGDFHLLLVDSLDCVVSVAVDLGASNVCL
jgi:hypothetical protein